MKPTNVLSFMALGLAVLLFSSMVTAQTPLNTVATAEVSVSDAATIHGKIKARLAGQSPEFVSQYRASIARLKANLADQIKSPVGIALSSKNVDRMLNVSSLSDDSRSDLARIYFNMGATPSKRYNFLLSSPENAFTATGKFISSQNGAEIGGILKGVSSESNTRFLGVWGASSIVGWHNGNVFWGTYTFGSDGTPYFQLNNFNGNEDVITGSFYIYP
ncbi:MAG: hypothetical protein AABY11_00735 [archaeon]